MTEEKLTELLQEHDWYFDKSDDHKIYTAGIAERAQLIKKAADFPEDIVEKIVKQTTPKIFVDNFIDSVSIYRKHKQWTKNGM